MFSKKILCLVTSDNEIKSLIKFSKKFKEKYKTEIDLLYVKDYFKYEIYPFILEGIRVNLNSNDIFKEYFSIEEKKYKEIEKETKKYFDKVYQKEGETVEVALEELKKYDLIVVVKNKKVSQNLKELLRSNFKPIIILPKNEINFSFDKFLLLDDGAYNANKTLFTYFYIFGEHDIDVLRVNVLKEDKLEERFGEKYRLIHKEGDTLKIIQEESKKYDFILMGDLRYTVMVEKITGKMGIRILESIDKPIFIG